MSKKSRQRNKKILAAIGIGLGAAAMASRKPKQSDVSQDSVEEVEIDLRLIQLKKTQLLLLQKLFKTINLQNLKKIQPQ
jgi:hypothetical protein